MVIPDVIDQTLLREIQEAWTRVATPIQQQWEEDIKLGEGIDGLFFKKPPPSSIAAPTTRGTVPYRTFCEICSCTHLPVQYIATVVQNSLYGVAARGF